MLGFEYKPTFGYTPPYHQDGNRSLQVDPSHTRRIIKAKQTLRIVQVSMVLSRFIRTPYTSRSKDAAWFEDQEEFSHS